VSPGMFEDHLTSLNTAWAFHDSGEGYVYEFAVNLETLNYLQTINLLDEDKLKITLEYMQTSKLCVLLSIGLLTWLCSNSKASEIFCPDRVYSAALTQLELIYVYIIRRNVILLGKNQTNRSTLTIQQRTRPLKTRTQSRLTLPLYRPTGRALAAPVKHSSVTLPPSHR